MSLITTTDELAQACQRLARSPFVTVDTEFLRETTFWPILCVVQVASDDEALAIDALAPGSTSSRCLQLMADEDVVKVFHAARQDLEIFWKLSGLVPTPLFDTQVAAMVCGYGEQVSYSELVQSICHVAIDKSSRFTDWARRPLAEAQIAYAIGDVTHLRDIYKALSKRVAASGRQSWLDDEMKTLTSPSTYEQHPERAWERYKNKARKPRDLAMLMELAAWRESEAQARDVPRARVLKDEVLIELALAAPRSAEALANLRAFPRGMERSRAGARNSGGGRARVRARPQDIAEDRARATQRRQCRRDGRIAQSAAQASERGQRRRRQADRHRRRPRGDRAERQGGCACARRLATKMFGEQALELKHGRLALTVENGKVVTLEWKDAEAPHSVA